MSGDKFLKKNKQLQGMQKNGKERVTELISEQRPEEMTEGARRI